MKKIILITLLVASAFAFPAKVIKIIDGDTIKVLTSDKKSKNIRFADVDSPETFAFSFKSKGDVANCVVPIEFGKASLSHLKGILKVGDLVEVELNDQTSHNRDVGTIWFEKKNINSTMVKDGYAFVWHSGRDIKDADYKQELLISQTIAKVNAQGLWKGENNSTIMECLIKYHK